MQTPSIRRGQAEGLSLTLSAYFAASRSGEPAPRVQVRKYHPEGPFVLCGQVQEVHEREGHWFKVETPIGPLWVEGRNVRLCTGDGRCTCEAVRASERAPC